MKHLKNKLKKVGIIKEFYLFCEKRYFRLISKFSSIMATKYIFKKTTRKKLNLNNPQTFNEKIQWLKLKWNNPMVISCADKYEVRKYVKDQGLEHILNELYYVYDNVDDLRWEVLPDKFALKLTNGSGTNLISDDKNKLQKSEVINILNTWMKTDFGKEFVEIHYSKMKSRVICEKYLETEQGFLPNDYKIFCFNGTPKMLYVGIIENGYTHKTFYDLEWNKMNILKGEHKILDFERPKSLNEMIHYATILSKPFPFVRVDFFDIDGKPVFGEMTFTPTGGLATYYTDEAQLMLGSWITLPQEKMQ